MTGRFISPLDERGKLELATRQFGFDASNASKRVCRRLN
jgi:hypothetical protein